MKTSSIILVICVLFITACSDDSPEVISGEGIFKTTSGAATIEGELFLPEGDGPFPAMIIIPGSGNEDRSELEPFAAILNANNYGLYIYDKRGIGGSTGSYPPELNDPTVFLSARADDITGIIELLKSHEQINESRIGLFGSSQGAWVNSLVYNMRSDLAFIIMVSGGIASTGLENLYCGLTDDPTVTIEEAVNQLSDFTGPVGFDPLPIVEEMSLPVLWIYGNEDRSHPARYDIDVLEQLNKSNFNLKVYENVNHEIVDLNTGQPPSDLFDVIGMWLAENNP